VDYNYIFSDFTDRASDIKVTSTANQYVARARIDDAQFTKTAAGHTCSVLADLIDIAAAVFISDWLLPRRVDESYKVDITLPIRNSQFFNQSWIIKELKDLLRWYTDDVWHFKFQPRNSLGRVTERCRKMVLSGPGSVEVALWSGGLDSLAGLCGRIVENRCNRHLLFGSGSNNQVQFRQSEVVQELHLRGYRQARLIQLPIRLSYPDDKAKPPTNDMFRARGFTFKLLGGVCALLEGQQTLHIYENGYGAINLPFTAAEVGLAHTRSVHPLSLLKLGAFLSKVTGRPFKYHNPYLFTTKAQMCSSVIDHRELAYSTITCDGRYRQRDMPIQCGYCSSCLLRRIALLTALGEDKTEYVATHGTEEPAAHSSLHFKAMDLQADELQQMLSGPSPWHNLLMRYPSLRELSVELTNHTMLSKEEVRGNLIRLYQTHVAEWMPIRHKLKV
jgi:hypothetical protein